MKTAAEHLEKYYKNFRKRIPYDENVLKAMESYAKQQVAEATKQKDEDIKKLRFMVDNGLGWKDMENDITYPPGD